MTILSRREQFAAMALQGFLSNGFNRGIKTMEQIVDLSMEYAAELEARFESLEKSTVTKEYVDESRTGTGKVSALTRW